VPDDEVSAQPGPPAGLQRVLGVLHPQRPRRVQAQQTAASSDDEKVELGAYGIIFPALEKDR
jgi:hypothetical protein